MPAVTEARDRRMTRTEAQLRRINDDLRRAVDQLVAVPELVAFVCECSRTECHATIELTVERYDEVRSCDRCFVIVSGHETPTIEAVAESRDGYLVVEKFRELIGSPAA